MNIGRLMRLRQVQDIILRELAREASVRQGGLLFAQLFVACGMQEGRLECGSKPGRFLDKAIEGLKRHGDIVYNRRTLEWELVEDPALKEAKS